MTMTVIPPATLSFCKAGAIAWHLPAPKVNIARQSYPAFGCARNGFGSAPCPRC